MNISDDQLHQPPTAAAMSESLRSLGYSPETAIADLVDNSIAAHARNVWISLAATEGAPGGRLVILDDGSGMSPATLLKAMRPGSRSPTEARLAGDLGRFGLGLKTASFSQCRCLTVATRSTDGKVLALRWDLDHIAKTDSWRLLRGPAPAVADTLPLLDQLGGSGTLVVWSALDGQLRPDDTEVFARLREHLALTFHRFLETDELRIHLSMDAMLQNSITLEAVDPFMRRNPATNPTPRDTLAPGCTIQGFVLPHPDRCSPEELEAGSLGKDWRDRQGCYVYRNRRLLVAGGWLGLKRGWKKDVGTQLARVCIDFTNEQDAEWAIDVMKSRATVPPELRDRLRGLAARVRDGSIAVFLFRHKRAPHPKEGKGRGPPTCAGVEIRAHGFRGCVPHQHRTPDGEAAPCRERHSQGGA